MSNIKFPMRRPIVSNIRKPMVASAAVAGGDPFWANVVLLVSMEGAEGSTTFTDEAGRHTVTPTSADVTTIENPGQFNNGCLDLETSNGVLTVSGNGVDFDFGTDDFTVEIGIFIASDTGKQIMGEWTSTDPEWQIYTTNTRPILVHSDLGEIFRATNNIPASTWTHLAFTRSSGVFYMYLGGVHEVTNSAIPTGDFDFAASNVFGLGQTASQGGLGGTTWNFNWARITKGVARYSGTDSFTPPTEGYPTN